MILTADFGGTTIKLGLVDQGRVYARERLPVDASRQMSDDLELVATSWEKLLCEQGLNRADCRGVALALPFLVDPKQSRVLGDYGKFPGATTTDFDAWSRERLGVPVALENDLRVALLGEAATGAAKGKGEVVMISLGTGIGCAALSGGRLFRGANNRAATLLGHGSVDHDGEVGRCGNRGCAEDLASTATLAERARVRADFATSTLASAAKIDFETVFDLAAKGDICSQALLQNCLRVWAIVVQNAVLAYDPEIVVLGGGVLRSRDVILPAIEDYLRNHMPGFSSNIPVVASTLGDDAALVGGEVLFQQTHPNLFP